MRVHAAHVEKTKSRTSRFQKLDHPSVREVFVTDTMPAAEKDWPQLQVVSIAPLIAGALERFLANGSIGDLY